MSDSSLDNNSILSRNGEKFVKVIGRKGRCKSNWCPGCSRYTLKKLYKIWLSMDFDRVRHVELSLNRDRFKSAKQAYEYIRDKKLISEFVRRLRRSGVDILQYTWILEWHKDGFAHWHFFIEVSQAGVRGKIGHDIIKSAWPYGYSWEFYILSKNHWRNMAGYLSKHGYFNKKKSHQSRLPLWALEQTYSIRRFGVSNKSDGVAEKRDSESRSSDIRDLMGPDGLPEWDNSKFDRELDYIGRLMHSTVGNGGPVEKKTNGEILESCGMFTEILVETESGIIDYGSADIRYRKFRNMDGEYIPGLGYAVRMVSETWHDFYRSTMFQLRKKEYQEGV